MVDAGSKKIENTSEPAKELQVELGLLAEIAKIVGDGKNNITITFALDTKSIERVEQAIERILKVSDDLKGFRQISKS